MAGLKTEWNGSKFLRELTRGLEKTVKDEAESMVSDIRDSFSSSAGSTNEAPREDTGRLSAGIVVQKLGKMRYGVGVEKSQTAKALTLEFGRRDAPGSAHPFMRPALKREKKPLNKAVKKKLNTGR